MLLTGLGLSEAGLSAGLAAYRPVMITLSAASLALSHWLVWRRGYGGTITRALLVISTALAPLLWWGPYRLMH